MDPRTYFAKFDQNDFSSHEGLPVVPQSLLDCHDEEYYDYCDRGAYIHFPVSCAAAVWASTTTATAARLNRSSIVLRESIAAKDMDVAPLVSTHTRTPERGGFAR